MIAPRLCSGLTSLPHFSARGVECGCAEGGEGHSDGVRIAICIYVNIHTTHAHVHTYTHTHTHTCIYRYTHTYIIYYIPPSFLALASSDLASSTLSSSTREEPVLRPRAFRNVNTIPPPITCVWFGCGQGLRCRV
jgi:hypothetical protein